MRPSSFATGIDFGNAWIATTSGSRRATASPKEMVARSPAAAPAPGGSATAIAPAAFPTPSPTPNTKASYPNDRNLEYSEKNDLPAVDMFKRSHAKRLWECLKCGNEGEATCNNICYGNGCPACRCKTEEVVSNFINSWSEFEVSTVWPTQYSIN